MTSPVPTKFTPAFILTLLVVLGVFTLIITGDVDSNVGLPILVGLGGAGAAGGAAAAGYQNGTKVAEANLRDTEGHLKATEGR